MIRRANPPRRIFAQTRGPALVERAGVPAVAALIAAAYASAQLAVRPLHDLFHDGVSLPVWATSAVLALWLGYRLRRWSVLYVAAIPYTFALWMALAGVQPHGPYASLGDAFLLSVVLGAAAGTGIVTGRVRR